jgi:adenylate cyclase
VERKLAAILCADVFGYSRLMGKDEEATLRTLTSHRKLIDSAIEQHHGRFVNSAGDSVLAEFASVVEAVNCAVDIQTSLKAENASLAPERRMEFRIGVNLGDVMIEGEQIYGDGVNIAARLESLADPGGICISNTVHDQVSSKLALNYADLGEQTVKNIAKPVRVYRVLLDGATATSRKTGQIRRKVWRSGILSFAGLAIVIATIVIVQHVSLKPQTTHASIPQQEKPALPLPDMPSIAVLPFTNLSGDSRQDYFSDGISDQLINNLSRLPGLFVIARNSSFAYKSKATKESEIGKELGVKYLLEGSVHKEADQVRIGVELVDASSGTDEWTAQYDRPLKDIFAVQDEIVGKVVTTLGLLLKLDEMKLPHLGSSRTTDNLDAFDDYLRGIENMMLGTKADSERARQWMKKAIDLDPKYAEAYASLGWLDMQFAWNQWSGNPLADLRDASELAQKALALDDTNSSALTLLSESDWMHLRYDQAVADGERAVAINPNYAQGYHTLSHTLLIYGKPEAAISAAQKAMRLDPTGRDLYLLDVGVAYVNMGAMGAGRYEDGIPVLKQSLATYPNTMVSRVSLTIAYVELGREEDARAEAAEITRMSPQFTLASMPVVRDQAWDKRVRDDLRKAGLK